MKQVFKIGCLVTVIVVAFIMIVAIAISDDDENKSKPETSSPEVSLDSIYKKANIFLNEKNYEYALKFSKELTTRDSSNLEYKGINNATINAINEEINNLKQLEKSNLYKTKHDDFKKITWFDSKKSDGYGNKVKLYFGKEDNGILTPLRLVIQYYGDDWIFWKTSSFLIDGVNIPFVPNEVSRDHSGGSVWETSDDALDINSGDLINKIIEGKNIKYRLTGKYYKDTSLTNKQIQGIKEIKELYMALKKANELEALLK